MKNKYEYIFLFCLVILTFWSALIIIKTEDSSNHVGLSTTKNISTNTIKSLNISRPIVIINFDDGWQSVYDNASPILLANDQKATVYIITAYANDDIRLYMNWSTLNKLYNLGWDISSHTVNHQKLSSLNDTQLNYELITSYNSLISHGFVRSAKFIAYPFGAYNNNVIGAVKANGYVMGRSVETGINGAYLPINDTGNMYYTMKVIVVGNKTSVQTIKNIINQTIKSNGYLIIAYHMIVVDGNAKYDTWTNQSDFKAVSDYLASRRADIDVMPISKYYKLLTNYKSIRPMK